MITEIKSYQIIIALLKARGIRHCVLSAGSRNVPFVHSIEEDPFFKCYSVVDERSAGYFALGLSQQLHEPVVISCTSSTATCNYWPPVAEAYYQGVPLIVLTGDRDVAMLGQREDQMIDQVGMYDRHVRKSVNLPVVKTDDDFIYCQRLVNEALLELDHNGQTGPVHINVPMKWYSTSFPVQELPKVTCIERLGHETAAAKWEEKVHKLQQAKRILVVCGQSSYISDEQQNQMTEFFHKFNCSISMEYMSNVECEGAINTSVCLDSRFISDKKADELLPDIVISYGGNVMQGVKADLCKRAGQFEHWLIQEDGHVCDLFKSLTTIFECTPEYFFRFFNEAAGDDSRNDLVYHHQIEQYAQSVKYHEFPWSNIYAVQHVVTQVPSGSIIHMSINNAIRLTNFFELQPNVKTYANIGTDGIDGCLSSFLGQAVVLGDQPAYLMIGDLAFFYDMNALRIRHIGNNIRIMLLNNHGGEEFYYNGMYRDKASDLHTTARHHATAKGWAESCGFKYLTASDKDSYNKALPEFMATESDKPIFFEVFSEMSTDSKAIYDFYDLSRPRDFISDMKREAKEIIKSTIGKETAVKVADKLGIKLK